MTRAVQSFPSGRQLPGALVTRKLGAPVTAYEQKLTELHLVSSEASSSPSMRAWVRANFRRVYVPESLLDALGLDHRDWMPSGAAVFPDSPCTLARGHTGATQRDSV